MGRTAYQAQARRPERERQDKSGTPVVPFINLLRRPSPVFHLASLHEERGAPDKIQSRSNHSRSTPGSPRRSSLSSRMPAHSTIRNLQFAGPQSNKTTTNTLCCPVSVSPARAKLLAQGPRCALCSPLISSSGLRRLDRIFDLRLETLHDHSPSCLIFLPDRAI